MTLADLNEYGVVRMDDDEIRSFLSNQRVGVLGLPTDGAPSMRPMTFGFDGEDTIYLLYVGGSESRKSELTERATAARFLAFSVETMFQWQSVLLSGRIRRVPDPDREAATETLDGAWRPDVFERASESVDTELYGFEADERVGVKHVGLPPGFGADAGAKRD